MSLTSWLLTPSALAYSNSGMFVLKPTARASSAVMARAGRFGQAAERYMKKHPEAVRLFRRITEANLGPEQLREMIRKIEHQESEDAQ
jgi:hypothetical protein